MARPSVRSRAASHGTRAPTASSDDVRPSRLAKLRTCRDPKPVASSSNSDSTVVIRSSSDTNRAELPSNACRSASLFPKPAGATIKAMPYAAAAWMRSLTRALSIVGRRSASGGARVGRAAPVTVPPRRPRNERW